MKSPPIAVAVADLHLTLTPPACRQEEDWLAVQKGYLDQLKQIAGKLPILCAGDVFDRWNPPPELINFALDHLPRGMFCVPGQHDLPNHRIEDMRRCGYGTLKRAGCIVDLSGVRNHMLEGLEVSGFGWEQPVLPPLRRPPLALQVALVHRYVWQQGRSYPGAAEDHHVGKSWKMLTGYNAGIFGDNHLPFIARSGVSGPWVVNCGTFIRRKSDERDSPAVVLLHKDGTVSRCPLDTSKDRFREEVTDKAGGPSKDMQEFFKKLNELGDEAMDFRSVVTQMIQSGGASAGVRQIIKEALDHGNEKI